MSGIKENVSLKPLNTFGIDVKARYFVEIRSENELCELISQSIYKDNKVLILGGGSNVLFTGDYDGLVIKASIMGRDVLAVDDHYVLLKAGSGEPWHDLVMH